MLKSNNNQIIVFDKNFKCIYRVRNVPKEWSFRDVFLALRLSGNINDYEMFVLDNNELCIDDWEYKDGKLIITDSICN